MSFRIGEIWAWTSVDKDDEEGIVAFLVGDQWMPLIGADGERIRSLESRAQQAADISGRPVHLRRFAAGEHVRTLEPQP